MQGGPQAGGPAGKEGAPQVQGARLSLSLGEHAGKQDPRPQWAVTAALSWPSLSVLVSEAPLEDSGVDFDGTF